MLDRHALIRRYHDNPHAIVRDSAQRHADGTLCEAAVLVPIVDRPEGLSVLLTQRSEDLNHHPGQVSFPGGRRDPNDPSLAHTALRETFEEIGIGERHIELLGPLASTITLTGFYITPYLALLRPDFELVLQRSEVSAAFEVPLEHLLDPANHQRREHIVLGQRRDFYEIPWKDRAIWGATAAMLRNLGRHLGPL